MREPEPWDFIFKGKNIEYAFKDRNVTIVPVRKN